MSEPPKLTRIAGLKTVGDFRRHLESLGIRIPCDSEMLRGADSPLARPVDPITINDKRVGNRYAIQPMEGWDATAAGGMTDEVKRRWQRFGESGAKLICGGEAMAVQSNARANPHQLIISDATKADLAELRRILIQAHQERYGTTDDLVIGFQLTHSGRFCRSLDGTRLEPRVAYRHPILDRKFGVTSDAQILSDAEVEQLIQSYISAARVAWEAGADFVDIKHCHGYLLHEFLSAYIRPGRYGGSFQNRTRILREIVQGIRAGGNRIEIGVRLSAFDFVPFRPDPAASRPGKLGVGIPEDFSHCLPYQFAFGVNPNSPTERDLTESFRFAELCVELGIKILNLSAGSPYYNPHIQRPAAYPPCDGYQPPEDPLLGVARQVNAVREIRAFVDQRKLASSTAAPGAANTTGNPSTCPLLIVGSAYSYLQEFLPYVAQAVVREKWADVVGIGRMVLSYPTMLADAIHGNALQVKRICRTFSDCTTAPRNGLVSGCYPLDPYYTAKPESQKLKTVKKSGGH
jgi:2,4-dienoyl-CoA reductase-like NADH-dependent reductase (Old Yellow Enzyme family)